MAFHASRELVRYRSLGSNSFYEALGSTSSRVPAGSCCRPLTRFARQAISVCPTVILSHWFSGQFLVLNDVYYEISLFNLKKNVPLYPAPEESGFYGQLDKTEYFMMDLKGIFPPLPTSFHEENRKPMQ